MLQLTGQHLGTNNMFDSLIDAVKRERLKLEKQNLWIKAFKETVDKQEILEPPWKETQLFHTFPNKVPSITQIAGVDGGIIAEAMTGFDLVLYRAVVAIFQGVGNKVKADYVPSFDPEPRVFFSPSLSSRNEFQRLTTLLRLYTEYEVAILTIEKREPTILFIDGKATPLTTDFNDSSSKIVSQIEEDVKQIYMKLLETSIKHRVLLCGVVKDSRSREYVNHMKKHIPYLIASEKFTSQKMKGWVDVFDQIQDVFFANTLLDTGERTAWLETTFPDWLSIDEKVEIWTCLIKPLDGDRPVRLEIIVPEAFDNFKDYENIALGSYSMLCNHGMPLALPTVILEADERTKMNNDHLQAVVDQISISLGIPKEQLRKRRFFSQSLT